jgi:transposase
MHTQDGSRSRRRHCAEFKRQVLAACDEPGASVAAVAHAHDLNANLVHKWRRRRQCSALAPTTPSAVGSVAATAQRHAAARTLADAATAFVPVQLEMPRAAAADIRLELRRGAATVIVDWPAQQAASCGRWLREWLG